MSTDDELDLDHPISERLRGCKADFNAIRNAKDDTKELKQSFPRKKVQVRQSARKSMRGARGESQFDSWIVPETPSPYQLGNKKRQNGDKHEQVAKSKRTCLSDRFAPCDVKNGFKNGFVENYPICKDFDPKRNKKESAFRGAKVPPDFKENHILSYMEHEISPDKTYENCAKNSMPVSDVNGSNSRVSSSTFPNNQITFSSKTSPDLEKPRKNNLSEPSTSRSSQECIDSDMIRSECSQSSTIRRGVQFIDSDSDEESKILLKSVALKGGRQLPECMQSVRKVIGKGHRKILDSDDSDDDSWQTKYRSRPISFSSSDSDDSSDVHVENHKKMFGKHPFTKLSSTDSNDGSLSSPITNSPLSAKSTVTKSKSSASRSTAGFLSPEFQMGLVEQSPTGAERNESSPSNVSHGNVPSQSKSNSPSQFRSRYALHESSCRRSGSPHPRALRSRRQIGISRFAVGQLGSTSHNYSGRAALANQFPDLFDPEDSSDVEFFTANSYSDTETSTESVGGIDINTSVMLSHPNYRNNQSLVHDPSVIIEGSSEDEISVIFSTNSPYADATSRRRQHRGTGRRRHSRGSSRRSLLNSQEIVSLSPDPVEQVRQMEEDERFARLLQAQFDAEVHQPEAPHFPSLMDSDTNEDEIIDPVEDVDIRPLPRDEMNPSTGHSAFQATPFQFASHIRGRSRFRQSANVFMFPGARRRQGRRRFHGFHTDPWMWQFARILGLGPTQHSSERDESDYEARLELAESIGEAVPRGLHKADINRLPTRKFVCPNRGASSSQSFDDVIHKRTELNKECQVCLCDYENGDVLRILPCFHEFHTPCIDPWLKINHTCPVCRVEVDLDE